MGKVMSMISRKVNRFNVENRAHRVLERDKPVPAPKFESNLRDLQRTLEVDPTFLEKLSRKDAALDDRLKNVYVTSTESFIDYAARRKDNEGRVMPMTRTSHLDYEFGYQEPTRITPGKCTLRQAIQFITDHYGDPELWTSTKIAEEYKLKESNVVKMLKHFRTFNVYIPDKGQSERILTQTKPKMIQDKKDEEST